MGRELRNGLYGLAMSLMLAAMACLSLNADARAFAIVFATGTIMYFLGRASK